jgi:hypothetical protein
MEVFKQVDGGPIYVENGWYETQCCMVVVVFSYSDYRGGEGDDPGCPCAGSVEAAHLTACRLVGINHARSTARVIERWHCARSGQKVLQVYISSVAERRELMILTSVCGGAASPANSAPQIYRAAAMAWHAQYARRDAEAAVSNTNISQESEIVL